MSFDKYEVNNLKIIQILHHSASALSANFQQVMFDGWHARLGKELSKRSNYDIECLTFDPILKKIITVYKDGVTYKAFPSSFSYGFLYEYSHQLIQYLKEVSSEKTDVIFHIHGYPGIMTYIIASKFRNNIVIIQDHGGRLSGSRSIWIPFGRYFLRNVDFFLVTSEKLREELIKYIWIDPSRIKVQTMGIDTKLFRPISKYKCREILRLPINKYLVIYVGRFDDFKGLPLLIKVVNKLKTRYDIELVAIGGYPTDPLFTYVKKKVPYSFERVRHEFMPYYYNASNVFAWFVKDIRYGGPGVSLMEAMSCNIPIVSNTLIHSRIGKELKREELEERGCYIPRNVQEFEIFIEKAIVKNDCKTRELAERYFSWDAIIASIRFIYEKLSKIKIVK
jgi:glycosyltransferase involved in cell wall biosynthesis